jgi:membrane dipeptidase
MASPARGREAAGRNLDALVQAGVDVALVPVAEIDGFEATVQNLLRLRQMVAKREDVVWLEDPADFSALGNGSGMGIVPTFQGMEMIVEALDLVRLFGAAGVGVIALTHAWKNWNGDGCFEASDLPLTGLGRMAVESLNDAGVLLDLSRVGRRSSLEAMEVSRHPVIFTHSNAAAVHDHPRNLTDRQIDACGATGGVVCVTAFPAFLSEHRPSSEDLLRHLDHVAGRIGPEHVGIGLDIDDRRLIRFEADPLPPPPYDYPEALTGPGRTFEHLAELLHAGGYSPTEAQGVLGNNVRRVLATAWGARSTA